MRAHSRRELWLSMPLVQIPAGRRIAQTLQMEDPLSPDLRTQAWAQWLARCLAVDRGATVRDLQRTIEHELRPRPSSAHVEELRLLRWCRREEPVPQTQVVELPAAEGRVDCVAAEASCVADQDEPAAWERCCTVILRRFDPAGRLTDTTELLCANLTSLTEPDEEPKLAEVAVEHAFGHAALLSL